MSLPIIEQPLYGEIKIETSPWADPFVWTDRTAELVSGMNYSIGGRVGVPGSSSVDVGTLNATFKDMASVPNVGALVRISFTRISGYAFTGYVQDVSQRIVFDDSVSYNTPITLTTLNCVDWVGYVSQFQAVGAGAVNFASGSKVTDSNYSWPSRTFALNKIIDTSYNAKVISYASAGSPPNMGDTDMVGTIADHLDLISRTASTYWFPKPVLPTNTTTGRDDLIEMRSLTSTNSSGKTFTDVAGSAGQLHYTEIDFENSTQNITNTVVVNNRARVKIKNQEITIIGGFNEQNFLIVNNEEEIGIGLDRTENAIDSTSITTYGNRQSSFETNTAMVMFDGDFNIIGNPSAEYSDEGWSAGANIKVRRRKPSEESTPFTAYSGEWAIRSRQTSTNNQAVVSYSGTESDGTPVLPSWPYKFAAWAARGTPSRSDARFVVRIDWYDDAESLISSSTSASTVTMTTANTWYKNTVSATSPASAVRATVKIIFTRPGALLHQVGDLLWTDGLRMTVNDASGTMDYFDGDTPWTSSVGYAWTGAVGLSPTIKLVNTADEAATNLLAQFSTTSNRATRIRWNAQESLTSVPALAVGKTISLIYSGTTTTYRIVGIDANIDPERYMIDYYLAKA